MTLLAVALSLALITGDSHRGLTPATLVLAVVLIVPGIWVDILVLFVAPRTKDSTEDDQSPPPGRDRRDT